MRKDIGGKLVKRAIVAAIATVLVTNTVITAMADEAVPVEESVVTEDGGLAISYSEDNQESIEDAADKAEEAVKEAQKAVDAVVEVKDTIIAAEEAAESASSVVEAIETLPEDIAEYNENVEEAQEEVDKLADELADSMTAEGDIIVETKTDENGVQSDVTLQDYVEEKADVAGKAAEQAKEILNNALNEKVSTDTDADKLKEYAEDAKLAADTAEAAKKDAEKAYNAAEESLITAIGKYNAYAQAYGLELKSYGDQTPIYTGDDLTLPNKTNEELVTAIEGVSLENLAEQEAAINSAQEAVQSAAENYGSIAEQAEAAKAAARLVEGYAQEVKDAAKNAGEEEQEEVTSAVDKAEAAEETAQEQLEILSQVQSSLTNAEARVDQAAKDYQKAKSELEEAKKEFEEKADELSPLDLSKLLAEIGKAEAAVNKAQDALVTAQASAAAAQCCYSWVNELQNDEQTRIYGQISKEGDVVNDNIKNFDLTDDEVESRNVKNFIEITENEKAIAIPDEIFAVFVKYMNANGYSNEDVVNNNTIGRGVATGGTMPVIYWVLDENGHLNATSKYYVAGKDGKPTEEMPYGTYFVGYTFKHEKDGYHIDGIMYNYTEKSEEEWPSEEESSSTEESSSSEESSSTEESSSSEESSSTEESSSEESSSTEESSASEESSSEPTSTPDNNTPGGDTNNNPPTDNNTPADTVTITDTPAPLADTLSFEVSNPDDQTAVIPDEPTPLAIIEEEPAPLAEAVPQTGDTSIPAMPFAVAGLGAIGAAFYMKSLKKKEEKENC